jgi:D-aminopeptidase
MAGKRLCKLANQTPVPVFLVVGRAGEAAAEELYLSPAVTTVALCANLSMKNEKGLNPHSRPQAPAINPYARFCG